MADSLRDQLIAAGFDAPKKKPDNKSGNNKTGNNKSRSKKRLGNDKDNDKRRQASASKKRPSSAGSGAPSQKHSGQNHHGKGKGKGKQALTKEAEELALERKKLKAQIKELIDTHQLKEWKGEVTYRYLVEKRIRELFVNEAAHKQLADREIAITRLNGDTYLVPLAIANEIKQVNPQWSVFNTDTDTEAPAEGDESYAEFQVPDDLKW